MEQQEVLPPLFVGWLPPRLVYNLPMRIVVLVVVAVCCVLAGGHTAGAQGGKFPGKGQRSDWAKANQLYNQANTFLRAGQNRAAIPLYEDSLRLYPFDSDFYMNAATAYAANRETLARAQDLIEKGIKLNPTEYVLQSQYAVILVRRGRLVEARDVLQRARLLKKTQAQSIKLDARLRELGQTIPPAKKTD